MAHTHTHRHLLKYITFPQCYFLRTLNANSWKPTFFAVCVCVYISSAWNRNIFLFTPVLFNIHVGIVCGRRMENICARGFSHWKTNMIFAAACTHDFLTAVQSPCWMLFFDLFCIHKHITKMQRHWNVIWRDEWKIFKKRPNVCAGEKVHQRLIEI